MSLIEIRSLLIVLGIAIFVLLAILVPLHVYLIQHWTRKSYKKLEEIACILLNAQ